MGQRVARTPFLRSLDEFRLLAAPLDERGPMSSVFVNLSCCPTHSTHSLFPFSLPPLNFLPSLLSHSFPPPLLSLSLALCPLSFTPPLCSLPPHRRQKRCRKKKLVEVPRGRPLHPSPTLSRCPFFFAEIEASFPHGVSQAMSSARAITRHSKRRGGTTRANDRNAATCHGS